MPSYPYSLTLTNPGAEAGNTTGWTNQQGTMQATSSQGGTSPRTGSFFFWAGTGLAAKAYQDVELPAELDADVDAGILRITGSAYHAGFTDDDGGWLGIWCLDASDRRIGYELKNNFTHHGVNAWTEMTVSGRIFEGTRKLRFTLHNYRGTGTNLDSYWDDISLTVTRTTETIRQTVNGCIYYDRFQDPAGSLGTNTDWTVISGTWNIVNSGIPDFFTSNRDTSATANARIIWAEHDAQGEMVVQTQWNNVSGSGTDAAIIARSDAAAENNYIAVGSVTLDAVRIFKQEATVYTQIGSGAVTQDDGVEYEVKTYWADGVQEVWVDGVSVLSLTDTTHDAVTGYGGYRTNTTGAAKEIRFDEYTIARSNTVTMTGLPTGYKCRVTGPILDGGANTTKTATESSGTATVDCDNLWFPANKVEVLDASDNTVAELSQFVFGGDEYLYATAVQPNRMVSQHVWPHEQQLLGKAKRARVPNIGDPGPALLPKARIGTLWPIEPAVQVLDGRITRWGFTNSGMSPTLNFSRQRRAEPPYPALVNAQFRRGLSYKTGLSASHDLLTPNIGGPGLRMRDRLDRS